ncbi:uncharacterized protein At3g60930, chloroplastic-like [Arabidopsis lyrata subsp. lyrata]|uniref:uncharacterized protein At3g60930, chloroplastic-like n=1 Tax=Arabidopsis lyrata subsp. lyrata TaxID=81972 RepID=UPI000A29E240|nr:uncharacterized protein At3g60930, chloroplastic-like [Arabidopsis lyrata subsp. lyrata]|eukprot:XP_020881806.1 uncharacterized protein At3g60930, chloroplastic-like [Arabidopsis lyrata subsp. lyrata]
MSCPGTPEAMGSDTPDVLFGYPRGDGFGYPEATGLGYYKMMGSGSCAVSESQESCQKKAAKEKVVLEANFRPPTPPEASLEVVVGAEATDEAWDVASIVPEVAEHISPKIDVPEVVGALVIAAPAAEAKSKTRGKRPRGDGSGVSRKEKRSPSVTPVYKDKIASANLVASCSGPPLSALEALLEAQNYRKTAAGFLKAFQSMNSMVRAYDFGARKSELVRERSEMSRAEVEARFSEAITAKQEAEALAKAEKVERLKASELEAEISRLHRLFTEEKALREKEIIRERRASKREFAEKVKAIEAKMDQYGKVSKRYMYLVQAWANAELIAELEEGKKVEDEKAEVLQWTAEYGDAEDEYVRLRTELREDLKLPPVSPDSVDDSFGNRSIEGATAAIGVADQSGSNRGTEVAQVSPVNQDSI